MKTLHAAETQTSTKERTKERKKEKEKEKEKNESKKGRIYIRITKTGRVSRKRMNTPLPPRPRRLHHRPHPPRQLIPPQLQLLHQLPHRDVILRIQRRGARVEEGHHNLQRATGFVR